MTITALADIGVNNYGDALAEARRCREDSALFDFSFMSRARVTGPRALHCLNQIQSRNLSSMQPGSICYSLCTDVEGNVEADITVWKFSDDCFEIFSGRHQDIERVAILLQGQNNFQDLSESTSVYALQGPGSLDLLCRSGGGDALRSLNYFQHDNFTICGVPCLIGRLGYTGEKGFEIIVDNPVKASSLWNILAELSQPAGVAAIDILRIEAGFVLFLNECRMTCNAYELGLGQFSEKPQSRCRFELVCFRADAQAFDMPWSPQLALSKPKAGEIIVSSASLSVLCDGVVGLGFTRLPYYRGNALNDPLGIFQNIKTVNKPLYDPLKVIPRS